MWVTDCEISMWISLDCVSFNDCSLSSRLPFSSHHCKNETSDGFILESKEEILRSSVSPHVERGKVIKSSAVRQLSWTGWCCEKKNLCDHENFTVLLNTCQHVLCRSKCDPVNMQFTWADNSYLCCGSQRALWLFSSFHHITALCTAERAEWWKAVIYLDTLLFKS